MKKLAVMAIAVAFILGTGSYVQCQTSDQGGGIQICPVKYRSSIYHADPDLVYQTSTVYKWWMDVRFRNSGVNTAYDVQATISCFPPGVTSDDNTVYVGTINPNGGLAWSKDPFTEIVDTVIAANPYTGICWQISYKDAAGNQYQITDIAKFCDLNCCEICDCTVIELNSFTSKADNGKVTLTWETATETDNVGFNILRAESENGIYQKINAAIIVSKGSPTKGAVYTFTDQTAKNRKTYYYKLEDVDLFGESTLNGPVSATPRWFSWMNFLGK